MENENLTLEEVIAKIESANLAEFQPGKPKHFTQKDVSQDPGAVLKKICSIYQLTGKPILTLLIRVIKVLRPKLAEALETFMKLMDTLCP